MYKRIVLKLSGEALAGEKKGVIFDDSIIWGLIAQIKAVMAKGTQVSLVIGGGNFWRGRSADSKMDRTKADQNWHARNSYECDLMLQMRSVRTASRHSYRHPSSSAQ